MGRGRPPPRPDRPPSTARRVSAAGWAACSRRSRCSKEFKAARTRWPCSRPSGRSSSSCCRRPLGDRYRSAQDKLRAKRQALAEAEARAAEARRASERADAALAAAREEIVQAQAVEEDLRLQLAASHVEGEPATPAREKVVPPEVCAWWPQFQAFMRAQGTNVGPPPRTSGVGPADSVAPGSPSDSLMALADTPKAKRSRSRSPRE